MDAAKMARMPVVDGATEDGQRENGGAVDKKKQR
jgi:hypothetical protein